MYEDLAIILYPDPRLRKISTPVESFDDALHALAAKMLELMRAHRGVGLAAPQVGHNIRMFVMNATGEPTDDKVYVNPVLSDAEGSEVGEEGCLSLPEIHADILRARGLHIRAQNLNGEFFEESGNEYIARVWQHEVDHLNGCLILDRMGPVARMTSRRTVRDLEDAWAKAHPPAPPTKPTKPARTAKKRR